MNFAIFAFFPCCPSRPYHHHQQQKLSSPSCYGSTITTSFNSQFYHHQLHRLFLRSSAPLLQSSLSFLGQHHLTSSCCAAASVSTLFSTHFSIILPSSLFFFIATIDLVDSSPYLSASSLPCFFSIGTITASLRFQNSAPPSSSFFLIDRYKQHLLSFLIVFSIIPSSLRFRWAATSPVTVSIFILGLHHLLQSLASSSSPLLSWSTPSAKVILL